MIGVESVIGAYIDHSIAGADKSRQKFNLWRPTASGTNFPSGNICIDPKVQRFGNSIRK